MSENLKVSLKTMAPITICRLKHKYGVIYYL